MLLMNNNFGGLLITAILIFNIFCLLIFLYLRFRRHDKNLDEYDDSDDIFQK